MVRGTEKGVTKAKSLKFAIRIVNLYKYLTDAKREYIMSKMLLRCGTSIGAYVSEGEQADSRSDFRFKMSQGLKAASETEYWLNLLSMTGYFDDNEFESIMNDCIEVKKLLHATVKSTVLDENLL